MEPTRSNPLPDAEMQFLDDLRATLGKRHRDAVLQVLSGLLLPFVFVAKGVLHLVWPNQVKHSIDLAWTVPLLLLTSVVQFVLFREYRRYRDLHGNCDSSVSAILRALLDDNQVAQERKTWMLVPVLLWTTVLAHQVRPESTGANESLILTFLMLAAIVLAVFLGTLWPGPSRKRELGALIRVHGNGR